MTILLPDADWFGSAALLYITRRATLSEAACHDLQLQCDQLEQMLANEQRSNSNLRDSMATLQRTTHDCEWRLQEKIAELQQRQQAYDQRPAAELSSSPAVLPIVNIISPTSSPHTAAQLRFMDSSCCMSIPAEMMLLQYDDQGSPTTASAKSRERLKKMDHSMIRLAEEWR